MFLTKLQNTVLNQNIETEGLFDRYEHDKDFEAIFDYKRDIVSAIRQLRIALRPLVLGVSSSTELARKIRKAGEAAGFKFPEEPAEVQMRGPTPVLDYLTPASDNFKPFPDLMDPTDGVENLDAVSISMIRANHEVNLTAIRGFQEEVVRLFKELYGGVSEESLRLDNALQFTLSLMGHVDGCLVELVRSKLLDLFKSHPKGEF